jgi:hypothetical protein
MIPQTVSLEVAKQLKEAGWKKETYFHYDSNMSGEYNAYPSQRGGIQLGYFRQVPTLKAPQLHEILEELPKLPYMGRSIDPLAAQDVIFAKTESGYAVRFTQSSIFVSQNNPHDAAALLWIWWKNNFTS